MVRNRPLLIWALSLAGGIVLAHLLYEAPRWWVLLAAFVYGGVALYALFRWGWREALCFAAGMIFMAMGAWLYAGAAVDDPHPPRVALITGRVVSAKEKVIGEHSIYSYTIQSIRLYNQDTGWATLRGQMWISGAAVEEPALPGQTLWIEDARISVPQGPCNPGGRNWRMYYWTNGTSYTAYPEGPALATGRADAWLVFWMRARQSVTDRLETLFPYEQDRTLMQALLLGDSGALDGDVRDAFSRLGISHVLAVSGLHVGFVVLLLLGAFRLLIYILPKRYLHLWSRLALARTALVSLLLWAYAALVGFSPSVVRAVVMAMTVLLSGVSGRGRDPASALSLAAIVVLLLQPMDLFSISFQLSFGAVIGIYLFASPLQRAMQAARLPASIGLAQGARERIRIPSGVAASLSVTVGAQLSTIPFLALYFGRLPLLGLLANLFAVPLAGAAVMSGIPVVALEYLWPQAASLCALFPTVCVRLLSGMARTFANLPAVSMEVAAPPMLAIALYCLLLFLLAPSFRKPRRASWRIAVGLSAGAMAISLAFWGLSLYPIQVEATVLDADGQAVVLRHKRTLVLVDGGESAGNARDAGRYYGRAYDAVVLTGKGQGRTGALAEMLDDGWRGTVYAPENMYADGSSAAVLERADELGVPVRPIAPGERISIGDIVLERLMPLEWTENPPVVYSLLGPKGESRMLISGPLSTAQEELFDFPATTLLVAANRGSGHSAGQRLLWQANPSVAIMPVSYYGGVGMEEAIQRMRLHTDTYHTDETGAVTIVLKEPPRVRLWGRER